MILMERIRYSSHYISVKFVMQVTNSFVIVGNSLIQGFSDNYNTFPCSKRRSNDEKETMDFKFFKILATTNKVHDHFFRHFDVSRVRNTVWGHYSQSCLAKMCTLDCFSDLWHVDRLFPGDFAVLNTKASENVWDCVLSITSEDKLRPDRCVRFVDYSEES